MNKERSRHRGGKPQFTAEELYYRNRVLVRTDPLIKSGVLSFKGEQTRARLIITASKPLE